MEGDTLFEPTKQETLDIEQENLKYSLTMKSNKDIIIFNIIKNNVIQSYIKKMTLNEIKQKEIHHYFDSLNSCEVFSDFIKRLVESKQLKIKEEGNKLIINFSIEYLLIKYPYDIELIPNRINSDEIVPNLLKEITTIKEKINFLENENNNLKKENIELKNEINEIKNENNNLKKK